MTDLKCPPHPAKYAGLTPVYNTTHRERDDNYSKVIVKLAPRWRIIECHNAEQWIIQKRSAEPSHQGVWRGVSYVVSREKLIELSASLGLLSESSKRAVLERLPKSISNTSSMRCNSQTEGK
jgi:hypothetical protein